MLEQAFNEGAESPVHSLLQSYNVHKEKDRLVSELQTLANDLLINSPHNFQTFEESVVWFMETDLLSREDGIVLLDMTLEQNGTLAAIWEAY